MHKIVMVESTLVLNDYDNRRQTTADRKGIKNDIMAIVDTLLLQ